MARSPHTGASSLPVFPPLLLGSPKSSLKLKTPLIAGSGAYSWSLRPEDVSPGFGALVLKGLTLEPRRGNPGLRMTRSGGGLMNSVGLENPGVDSFTEHILPGLLARLEIPLIVNINGNSFEDYVRLGQHCQELPEIDALEINISCPNVREGGRAFGLHPETASALCSRVRAVTDKPLLVKLSPQVSEILPLAEALVKAGADILTLCNSFPGIAVDSQKGQPVLGNIWGGLSGTPVKPIVLGHVWKIHQTFPDLPLIALGGIGKASDALEYIQAGASAVSLVSACYSDSRVPEKILQGLSEYCRKNKTDPKTLKGKAHLSSREES